MPRITTGEDHLPVTEPIYLPPMQNVAANATAFIDLPLGYRYHNLAICYGGTTFDYTYINAIRLIANGETFYTISGTDRNAINQYLGLAAGATGGAGILLLPFERIGMEEIVERYRTCINTGVASAGGGQSARGIQSFRMEIDIGAATAPTIALYADVSDVNIEQSTVMPRIDTWTEAIVASSEYLQVNTPKRMLSDRLRPASARLWMKDTIAHITSFRTRMDGVELWNRTTTLNEAVQKMYGQRHPQSGYVALDWEEKGEGQRLFQGLELSTFDMYATHAAGAATPLTLLLESYGPLAS